MEKEQKYDIEIEEYNDPPHQNIRLIFNPTDRAIYTHGLVGSDNSMSPDLWHKKHVVLFVYSPSVVPKTLETWLEKNIDRIEAIYGLWEGLKWNGSNCIGTWSDWYEVEDLSNGLAYDFHASDEIRYFIDPEDFLQYDDERENYARSRNRDEILDDLIQNGEYNDCHVRRDDLSDYLDRLAEEHLECLAMEKDDEKK